MEGEHAEVVGGASERVQIAHRLGERRGLFEVALGAGLVLSLRARGAAHEQHLEALAPFERRTVALEHGAREPLGVTEVAAVQRDA